MSSGQKKPQKSDKSTRPALLTNAVPSVLLFGGGGDGVAVVTAEEDHWALEGGGEVEAGVCVALAGGSLAKVTDDGAVQVFPLDGVCSASS